MSLVRAGALGTTKGLVCIVGAERMAVEQMNERIDGWMAG